VTYTSVSSLLPKRSFFNSCICRLEAWKWSTLITASVFFPPARWQLTTRCPGGSGPAHSSSAFGFSSRSCGEVQAGRRVGLVQTQYVGEAHAQRVGSGGRAGTAHGRGAARAARRYSKRQWNPIHRKVKGLLMLAGCATVAGILAAIVPSAFVPRLGRGGATIADRSPAHPGFSWLQAPCPRVAAQAAESVIFRIAFGPHRRARIGRACQIMRP
jgi:hypothetical protein